MEEIVFENSAELFERIKPALNSKLKELTKEGIDTVKKEDIWNYLIKNKWKDANNLLLSDMVNDVLRLDAEEMLKYLETKMKERRVSPHKMKIDII